MPASTAFHFSIHSQRVLSHSRILKTLPNTLLASESKVDCDFAMLNLASKTRLEESLNPLFRAFRVIKESGTLVS